MKNKKNNLKFFKMKLIMEKNRKDLKQKKKQV